MKKKVTVGLLVFNGAREIKDCIDSLLNQSFRNFELIISDNCSEDDTELICRKYASIDDRIRYIRQPFNKGGVANCEFLLKEAAGDYFMWAAHDDIWSENYLQEAIALLEDRNFDFVFPRFELSSIDLKIHVKRDMNIFNFVKDENVDTRVISFLNLHTSSHKCNIVYSFFRTEFLRKVFKIQNQANDGLFGMVVLKFGRGQVLQQALFSKRYRKFWPGFLDWARRFIPNKNIDMFYEYKKRGEIQAISLFPEYEEQIIVASSRFKPYEYKSGYQI